MYTLSCYLDRLLKAGKQADKRKAYNISFLRFKIRNRELSDLEGLGDMYVSHIGLKFHPLSGSSLPRNTAFQS